MKNFNIFGVHEKTQVLERAFHEKSIYRRIAKKGDLGSL